MTDDEQRELAAEIIGPVRQALYQMMTLIEQSNTSLERLIGHLEILELERLARRTAPPQMRRGDGVKDRYQLPHLPEHSWPCRATSASHAFMACSGVRQFKSLQPSCPGLETAAA
jgi:hypothetical protein